MNQNIKIAADLIQNAEGLLICAGAGMGADSGLPTFRENEGFWNAYPALRHTGISFEEMADPRWFEEDPRKAWAFYGHRYNLYKETQPHEGFQILRNWASSKPNGAFVFTSNVDGHFQAAGFKEDQVCECHGSIRHFQCTQGCEDLWLADQTEIPVDLDQFEAKGDLPMCPSCERLARPNILMFGDWNWDEHRTGGQEENLNAWLTTMRGKSLAVIEIGAGKSISTVRDFSDNLFEREGVSLVRINPTEPQTPDGGISLPMGGLEGLEAIEQAMG